jgi:hypothetical protein
MESDAELAQMVDDEAALRAKLSAHFSPVLDEPVPDRLTALLATGSTVDDT